MFELKLHNDDVSENGKPKDAKLKMCLKTINQPIKDNTVIAKAYWSIAKKLEELCIGKPEKKELYYEQALDCYEKAIELNKENAAYYSDRVKLYSKMGNFEQASFDLIKANELDQKSNLEDSSDIKKIEHLSIMQTTKSIGNLCDIESKLTNLVSENLLEQELADRIRNVFRKAEQAPRKDATTNEKFEKLQKKIEELVSAVKDREDLKASISSLEATVAKITEEIDEVKDNISDITDVTITHGEHITRIQEVVANLEPTIREFYTKIGEINQQLEASSNTDELAKLKYQRDEELKKIFEILECAGIIKQVELKQKIEDLKVRDNALYEYFTILSLELRGYLHAYQELNIGIVKGANIESLIEPKHKNAKWFATLLGGAGIAMITSVVDNYSYGAMSALTSIKDKVASESDFIKFKNQVTNIFKVIHSKFTTDGKLDEDKIIKLALKLAELREKQITQLDDSVVAAEEQKGTLSKFDKLLGNIKNQITGELTKRYDKLAMQLAADDALMLISYFNNEYDNIQKCNSLLPEFFNAWKLAEIEVTRVLLQSKNTLPKIKDAVKNCEWNAKDSVIPGIDGPKNIAGRLTEDYIKGKLGSLYSQDYFKAAKMIIFALVNIEIDKNLKLGDKHQEKYLKFIEECRTGFSDELIIDIALNNPAYFVSIDLAKNYIKDEVILSNVVDSLSKDNKVQVYTIDKIEYNNPVLKNLKALVEFQKQYGFHAANVLINIGELILQNSDDMQNSEYNVTELGATINHY